MMSKQCLTIQLILLLILPIFVISDTLNSQRSTLLTIKQQWGNYLPDLSMWNPATSPCSWYGIQCSGGPGDSNSTRVVIGISLCCLGINSLIPLSICELKTLENLDLSANYIPGGFPTALSRCQSLTQLDLSGNLFVGPIPDDLDKLLPPSLQYLNLNYNNFHGNIPKSIGVLRELRTLYLVGNMFSGTYPSEISNLSKLEDLQMDYNYFTGEVPAGLWTLPLLNVISFSFNGFTGEIPAGIASWKNIKVFSAANNMLSGTLPLGLTSLSRLNTLNLEGNQLSGELPLKMDSWASLETLNLARNKFSGPIPAAIGSLTKLIQLDLSWNDLSGQIPSEFEHLKLTFLDLSNNKLSGKIPSSLDTSRIPTLPRCSRFLDLSSKKMAMIIALVGIIFSIAVCIIVFAIRKKKRKKQKVELPPWVFTFFQRVEFSEVNIISNLTEQHVIGSGGSGKVYRVQVDSSGYFVAVKKIWNNNQLNNAQFLAEVEILGNIRHANIVKLLCCISNEKTKLLVYEYLENQSLDRWLHKRRRLALERRGEPLHVLDWPTRLRIAISVARGLCYMHHDCAPPIIHRDIKSSNILLDSEFNAKIADFGFARSTVKQGELYTMSSVAGTFGYLAPEYRNARKVNEKIDVYSFGVVLLELATGKEPNSRYETLNLADSSWRHYCEDKLIVDGLDTEVMHEDDQEEMTMVFKLGLMCTSPLPNSRPSMKEVLQVLSRSNPLEVRDGGN